MMMINDFQEYVDVNFKHECWEELVKKEVNGKSLAQWIEYFGDRAFGKWLINLVL